MGFRNIFQDENGRSKVLYACAVSSGSPRTVELGARMGFDVVWIEMEHTSADLATAELMCVAAEAGGAVPLVRTSGYRREHILHALEVGGKIIVVPMVNDAEAARDVVKYGKFRPLGQRGFNRASRGLHFGLESTEEMLARANAETYLLPQIETMEAVRNINEILMVEGLNGIFIGPGDLSADMGLAGKFESPQLIELVCSCISKAKDRGLHAGVYAWAGPLFDACLRAGADLFITSSELRAVMTTWRQELQKLKPHLR